MYFLNKKLLEPELFAATALCLAMTHQQPLSSPQTVKYGRFPHMLQTNSPAHYHEYLSVSKYKTGNK